MLAAKLAPRPETAKEIKKVAVLGSGVMGAAIAANVANAGIPVLLIDIVPKDASDRNMLAKAAIDKMLKLDPSPFTHPDNAKLVTACNLEDDLGKLADVDWIIEAVLERIDVKHDVYKKVDANRKKGSIVSSNTSTIPLHKLTEGMSEQFQKDFVIAHFFNPPRYLRLLELVGGEKTSDESLATIREFCDTFLGKGVVPCKDTPGFIGNRIGCYWLQVGYNAAIEQGVTVEEADAVMGRPAGIPKTAVFGLYDLIGIDLMVLIGKALTGLLPSDDPYSKAYKETDLIKKMIADGYTGRKGKGGFYRMVKDAATGKKSFETLNLKSGEYASQGKADLESAKAKDLKTLFGGTDKGSAYAWKTLSETIVYAADLVGEIADDIAAIDEAMKTGYGWKYGPFEMVDKVGAKWFAEKLKSEGRKVPDIIAKAGDGTLYKTEGGKKQYLGLSGKYENFPSDAGIIQIADLKLTKKPVFSNPSASLWDIGDGVACLEFTSKMNAVDNDILDAIEKVIETLPKNFKALVIGNDADNFSVGANLNFFLTNAKAGTYQEIENIIARGQKAFFALKYSPFPVVSGLAGMALGGGCEVVLHSNGVNAHIESYAGLVEIGVGVNPGWGGCKEILLRNIASVGDAEKGALAAFDTIASARVSKSAQDAKDMMILPEASQISMNRLRVIADAKRMCLEMAKSYKAGSEQKVKMPGQKIASAISGKIDLMMASGKAAPHDKVVMGCLARILSGGATDGEVSETKLYDLEREVFMELVKTPATQDRIEYMLNNGKPLKN